MRQPFPTVNQTCLGIYEGSEGHIGIAEKLRVMRLSAPAHPAGQRSADVAKQRPKVLATLRAAMTGDRGGKGPKGTEPKRGGDGASSRRGAEHSKGRDTRRTTGPGDAPPRRVPPARRLEDVATNGNRYQWADGVAWSLAE